MIKKLALAAVLFAGATSAQAAALLVNWKYESPTILRAITLQDNVVIQDVNVGSGYNGGYGLWNGQTLSANFNFAFNITDALNNLLHTYTFSGTQGSGAFSVSFASAAVGPISPVVGPNIVATGAIQNVGGFGAGNDSYTMAFQTAAVSGAIPEPAAWGLMIAGFGMVGVSLRRRSKAVVA
ncbi:PEPxxWA-CTERM sorting domain-containing protein [Sandarakinorhabdus sp.]|uniref:PEPxxWA-CTERM sorting domain-containing protein n=1 Tax=Sandarakinorhabdus sp. TaxID=1916663 RepID=UPI00286D979A|nr:PEPxxWA-CTERM sorting domain-containing protein [Sandarakinorhabdus sp.]